jgi:undecaprenyl-diphosphatase
MPRVAPPRPGSGPNAECYGVVSSPIVNPHWPAGGGEPEARRTRSAWAVAGFLSSVVAFAVLAWNAAEGVGLARVDPHFQAIVVRNRVDGLIEAFRALAWLGSTVVLAPVVALAGAVMLARRRDVPGAVLPVAALVVTVVAKNVAKAIIERPRPPSALAIGTTTGFAFPSGHAADSLAVYVSLALILSVVLERRWRWSIWSGAVAVIVVVGASRVYLGAHWLTDVLGGWALAGGIVSILAWALALARRRRSPVPRLKPPGGPART